MAAVTPALTAVLVALLLTAVLARIVLPLATSQSSSTPNPANGQGPSASDPDSAQAVNVARPTRTAAAGPAPTARVAHLSTATVSATAPVTVTATATATPKRAAAQRGREQLVRNGGFESGADGWWTDPKVTVVQGDAHRGDSAIQITWAGGYADQAVSFTPGTTYILSAWGRTSVDVDPGSVGVVYRDANGVRLLALEPAPLLFNTPTFSRLTLTFVPPPDVATVHVFVWKAPGLATFAVDDLSLRTVAASASTTPTARPASD